MVGHIRHLSSAGSYWAWSGSRLDLKPEIKIDRGAEFNKSFERGDNHGTT